RMRSGRGPPKLQSGRPFESVRHHGALQLPAEDYIAVQSKLFASRPLQKRRNHKKHKKLTRFMCLLWWFLFTRSQRKALLRLKLPVQRGLRSSGCRCGNQAEVRRVDIDKRRRGFRMVQNIHGIEPELHGFGFVDLDRLAHIPVESPESGSLEPGQTKR